MRAACRGGPVWPPEGEHIDAQGETSPTQNKNSMLKNF